MAAKGFNQLLNAPTGSSPKRRTSPISPPKEKRPIISPRRTPTGPSAAHLREAVDTSSLTLRLKHLPPKWGTWEVYEAFSKLGNLSRIEIFRDGRREGDDALVVYTPAPANPHSIKGRVEVRNANNEKHQIEILPEPPSDPRNGMGRNGSPEKHHQPNGMQRKMPELVTVPLEKLEVGVMATADNMLTPFTVNAGGATSLAIDTKFKRLVSHFTFAGRQYMVKLDLMQIARLCKVSLEGGSIALVVEVQMPPLLFRKTNDVGGTHDSSLAYWNESMAYYRQVGINNLAAPAQAVTQLRKEAAVLDAGRWLTYCFTISQNDTTSMEFNTLGQVLIDNNVKVQNRDSMAFTLVSPDDMWAWAGSAGPSPSALQAFAAPASMLLDLRFDVRYQLEACLSSGVLHECNLSETFIEKLSYLDPSRATKMLEKAAELKNRFYDPMDIFKLQTHVSVPPPTPGNHNRANIRGAVVTPTTIYFAAPVTETSNRIIREYRQHEDRFLRVKFTDERYKGKLMGFHDKSNNELLTRVKRTMQNGIQVGDRHYEFLAFGNSQFRENGAYFFAPIGDITAAYIRARMGDFTKYSDIDRNVAKYASRLGQCFSTTQGMSIKVRVERLADIERNGYCFTDGVGKISPFLAQMIAEETPQITDASNYPSVFQFRLGGCKGVLAVDPSLKGLVVQIRPSQEKFPARYHGLEICRSSQNSGAKLNVQIILVLNALGIGQDVFVKMVKEEVRTLSLAMTDEHRAVEKLYSNIDYSRTTLTLADMINDGFMAAKDPFMRTCLDLWRSWSSKYLKEKAQIPVTEGSFVFGCVDEFGILKGHFERPRSDHASASTEVADLPEVFLQVEHPPGKGKYKIIEGICTLARNPSLHPGDIRTVRAIDVPELHHLKDCVVLPQTGDRDLANMCSGGDLDGDDYLVMWDERLLPVERNHPPMDYTAPPAVKSSGPVTVDDITSFFVTHIKNDAVGRIASAHKYWAEDQSCPLGIKDPKCIELAQLHSMAVDYAKTGVPAVMPKKYQVKRWPHWAEKKDKPMYTSRKVLGKLYDEVQRVPFVPSWDWPFDERILNAYQLDEHLLEAAGEIKSQYDEAVRRVMSQHGIGSEFEIWTTFVMEHNQDENDYKIAEKIGETVTTLKRHHVELCYEKAGTTVQKREWEKMGPFIAAMYTVTATQLTDALEASKKLVLRAGQHVPVRQATFTNMPFMSFPWLFPKELGDIANARKPGMTPSYPATIPVRNVQLKQKQPAYMSGEPLEELEVISTAEGVVHEGEVLEVHHRAASAADQVEMEEKALATTADVAASSTPAVEAKKVVAVPVTPPSALSPQPSTANEVLAADTPLEASPACSEKDQSFEKGVDPSDDEAEEVCPSGENQKPSTLDKLSRLLLGDGD